MLSDNIGPACADIGAERREGPVAEPKTMRALRIVAPRQIELDEVELPQPGPGQVRVHIQGCGVCGSDLSVWQGQRWFDYPRESGTPGHEGWGVIDKCGARTDRISPGQRVAFLSTHAYAEYDLAAADALVPIPPGCKVFPGEALGCAVNAFERSAIERGQTVAVIGAGFLGTLLIQLAASAGARVIAVSRRPFALDVARRCGARETLLFDDTGEVAALVKDLTGGEGCERVIEAAGAQQALDLATELIAVRGRLIIAGYHQDGSRVVDLQRWNWRGIDVINAHERDPGARVRGMAAVAPLLASNRMDPGLLYTHSFEFERAAEAFGALENRPQGFLKGWIRTHNEINQWAHKP